jgi:hypothetical protein
MISSLFGSVFGAGYSTEGLGRFTQASERREVLFGFANGAEHEFQALAIFASKFFAEALRLSADLIEDTAPGFEPVRFGGDFIGATIDEKLTEDFAGAALAWHGHAAIIPGEVPLHGRTDDEVAIAGVSLDSLGGVLIERNAVVVFLGGLFDAIPRHAGEESGLTVMVIVLDVRDAGEERELAAMLVEMSQVACALVF